LFVGTTAMSAIVLLRIQLISWTILMGQNVNLNNSKIIVKLKSRIFV